ncbi:acyl-CoA thioesterase [Aquisphaera insulae]|uniref:acyl-CoA thioesterase n=1 Tax=Aquisphaera insulae TaxID=2712864 RepID=UPI0013EB5DC6|nr:acyl-CoA thioesterase [Aquisphaera insulae]
MHAYEYRHVVGFEETNLVGNVYYVNHLRWQGRCRELFLRDHAPGILAEMGRGLAFVTVHVHCDYFQELHALDEITIRMELASQSQNRLSMRFEYFLAIDGREELIARGEQQIACMRREGPRMVPVPLPAELQEALRLFASARP